MCGATIQDQITIHEILGATHNLAHQSQRRLYLQGPASVVQAGMKAAKSQPGEVDRNQALGQYEARPRAYSEGVCGCHLHR
jgi:hypothetical protein